MHESLSQYSKSKVGGDFNDNMSRIEYDNISQNSGFKRIDYDKQSVGSIEDGNVGTTKFKMGMIDSKNQSGTNGVRRKKNQKTES